MNATRLARLRLTGPLILAGVLALGAAQGAPPGTSDLERRFASPPDDTRIMMRWWWFGPTVTKSGLEREMRLMKEGGIGGFEIQPVYPVVLDDPAAGFKTHPFLSDAFLDHVRFAAAKARELGLRADLTIGSGWPYRGAAGRHRPGRRQAEDRARPGASRQRSRPGARHPHRRGADGGVPGPVGAGDNDERPAGGIRRLRRRDAPAGPCAARPRGPVLHQQPHRHDGETAGCRRGRVRPQPLRSRRRRPLPGGSRRPPALGVWSRSAVRRVLRQSRGVRVRLDRRLPRRVQGAPRLRPAAAPARARPRRRAGHRRDPPRLGPDAHRPRRRAVPRAHAGMGGQARHAVPHPGLRHSARHDLEQRGRRPARRRGRAVEDTARVAMGGIHRAPLRPARHLVGDLDVAATRPSSWPRPST